MTSSATRILSTVDGTSPAGVLFLLAVSIAFLPSLRLPAQGPGEEWAELQPDLLTAQEESLRQGVPLIVFAIGKHQEEKTLALLHKDWFARDSKDFLVLVASPEEHEWKKVANKNGQGPRFLLACKVFLNAPCGSHRDALRALTKELKLPKGTDGKAHLPQILFLSPDQRILSHWGKLPSDERLRIEMKLAQRHLDQGFTKSEREVLDKKFKQLRKRFMKTRSARLKIAGNELMALPDPAARKFLQDVASGKVKKARRPHRITALQVLSMRGSYDALPPLLSALDDSDTRIRDAALIGLAEVRLQKAAKGILAKSKAWKKLPHYEELALALIRSDPDSPEVQAWFKTILSTGRPADRLEVMDALLLFEHPTQQWRKLVQESATIRNRKVQEKAARVLATFESRK